MKIITLLIVTLSLQGCGLGLLTNLAGGGDAPSISANVGENVETNEGISAKNNSDAFNNDGDVNNTKADMMTLCVHYLSKAICECKTETRYLPITNCNAVMR